MTASNRRAWRRPWSAKPAGSASGCTIVRRSGTSPPSARADEPNAAATAPLASRLRALVSPFNASANGANGRPPSPRSRQPPTSVRAPPADARARSSAISRLLPTPASPATRTRDGRPDAAASSADSRRSSSGRRPTKIGLLVRRLTRSIMGTASMPDKAGWRAGDPGATSGDPTGGPHSSHPTGLRLCRARIGPIRFAPLPLMTTLLRVTRRPPPAARPGAGGRPRSGRWPG